MTALQNQTLVLVIKAIFVLRSWMDQNFGAGLPYIRDVMADMEVCEEQNHTWQLGTTSCGHSIRGNKVDFIDIINHRIAALSVRNRYSEHFCPQSW